MRGASIETYDVCVVGSGITALVAAGIFASNNFRVCLVGSHARQKNESDCSSTRYYSLSLASKRIFELLSVWKHLSEVDVGLVNRIQIWGEGAQPLLDFPGSLGERSPLAWILENKKIILILLARVRELGVDIIESDLISIESTEESSLIRLEKCSCRAGIVVGADGRESKVRESTGIPLPTKKIDQVALVALVRAERIHQNVACQRFLETGPVAFLPLSDPHLSSIVWSCRPSQAKRLAEGGEIFNEAITSVFGHRYGKIIDSQGHMTFNLESGMVGDFFLGRSVLVGESAHMVHPLAGQGLNTALLDVASLAECIDNKSVLSNYSSLSRRLRRYDRWRKAEVLKMLSVTDGLNSLFCSRNIFISALREFGMRGVDSLPCLKKLLIDHATGVSGDVPKILR